MGSIFVWKYMFVRRLDRDSRPSERLEELERRVEELEESGMPADGATEERILELEERLDFTERLLSQQSKRTELPPHD